MSASGVDRQRSPVRRRFLHLVALPLALAAPIALSGQEPPPERDNTTVALQLGAGSLHGWNVASVTYELFPRGQDQVALFAVAGLGTILGGAGVAYYTSRYGTGLTASAVAGIAGAHVNAGGRIRLSSRSFLTGGVGYGLYFLQLEGFMPYLAWERRL